MKRFVITVCTAALLTGCTLNQAFVKSVSDYTDTILPEYREYVESDTTLSDDTRRIRKQTADKFQALVDDAMKEASDE